jgi:hypothetical protein
MECADAESYRVQHRLTPKEAEKAAQILRASVRYTDAFSSDDTSPLKAPKELLLFEVGTTRRLLNFSSGTWQPGRQTLCGD